NSRELFDLFQSGDSKAAAEIFNRYVARLIGLVRKRLSSKLGRRVDPEDIVQSAYRSFFLRAREEQYVLDRAGDLWRLLVTITLNKLYGQVERHTAARRDVAREEPATSTVLQAIEPAAPRPTPADEAALYEQLEQVMKQLSPLARRVVELRLRGDTIDEIAEVVQRLPRTIRRILDSARKRFEADHAAVRDCGDRGRFAPEPRATLRYSDFVLEQLVGRGGVGRVYRATQRSSGKVVAVKALLKSRQTSGPAVEQFIQEAAILSRLDHPNIVRTLGLGQFPGGGYFLAMEYVDGENLQSRLERGPLDANSALTILLDVTKAVAYAHDQGVVHCDLKPANVLMDQNNRVVVSDFGFAQLLIRGDPSYLRAGYAVGGTAGYLAPELLRSKRAQVSPGADIYSLGALLQALLTGHPPAMYGNRLAGDAGPSIVATSPAPLHRLCTKCLAVDPAHRFQSASQVLEELAAIQALIS
ncbi:MAG TPA: protein kinase, partial [Lacipirellulaceae bacterium]|nr:protein kinase [Lacipirellulaceae bacterium]